MSQVYSMAVETGFSALESLITGSNAKSRAAFNAAYANESARIAGRNRMNAAQRNLAAIRQDKILTNKSIQLQNTQAQAMSKLSAAVAGVTGNSVEDVSQQHDTNTSFAMANTERQVEQLSEQFLATISGTQMQLSSIQDKKITVAGELMDLSGRFMQAAAADGSNVLKMFGG